MSNAPGNSRTIFVGSLPQSVDEEVLVSTFSTFGEILDVKMPREGARRQQQHQEGEDQQTQQGQIEGVRGTHRGFAFLVFSQDQDALDAIDNMHLNELAGRIINVNIAKPLKTSTNTAGYNNRPVWEDEEWIKKYAKPLGQEGVGKPEVDAGES